MPPLRIDRLAGRAEQPGAIVSVRTGKRRARRLEQISAVQRERDRTPGSIEWNPVVGLDVDTRQGRGADVDAGLQDVAAARDGCTRQSAGCSTRDRRAVRRVSGVQALREVKRAWKRADLVLDLDPVVIDAAREIRQHARRERDTEVDGVGHFRSKLRVTAGELSALSGYALRDRVRRSAVAELCCRDARVLALRQRCTGWDELVVGIYRRGAGIHAQEGLQTEVLRVEQLDDVRRADRMLERGAQRDVRDGRVLQLELVGIGLTRQRVVGIAVARVEIQVVNSGGVFRDRNASLDEPFLDTVPVVDRYRGRAGAREQA